MADFLSLFRSLICEGIIFIIIIFILILYKYCRHSPLLVDSGFDFHHGSAIQSPVGLGVYLQDFLGISAVIPTGGSATLKSAVLIAGRWFLRHRVVSQFLFKSQWRGQWGLLKNEDNGAEDSDMSTAFPILYRSRSQMSFRVPNCLFAFPRPALPPLKIWFHFHLHSVCDLSHSTTSQSIPSRNWWTGGKSKTEKSISCKPGQCPYID